MNYRVVWLNPCLDSLAELYIAASPAERERMATGGEALNRRLADDPFHEGESREGMSRLTFPPLLKIRFRVDTNERVVRITDVARSGR